MRTDIRSTLPCKSSRSAAVRYGKSFKTQRRSYLSEQLPPTEVVLYFDVKCIRLGAVEVPGGGRLTYARVATGKRKDSLLPYELRYVYYSLVLTKRGEQLPLRAAKITQRVAYPAEYRIAKCTPPPARGRSACRPIYLSALRAAPAILAQGSSLLSWRSSGGRPSSSTQRRLVSVVVKRVANVLKMTTATLSGTTRVNT